MYRIKFPVRVQWVEELVCQIKESPDKMAEVTDWQKDNVKALYNMPLEEVAVSDVPLKPSGRSKSKTVTFHKPVMKDVTLKLDENVVDWYEWYEEGKPRDEILSKALLNHIDRFRLYEEAQRAGKSVRLPDEEK